MSQPSRRGVPIAVIIDQEAGTVPVISAGGAGSGGGGGGGGVSPNTQQQQRREDSANSSNDAEPPTTTTATAADGTIEVRNRDGYKALLDASDWTAYSAQQEKLEKEARDRRQLRDSDRQEQEQRRQLKERAAHDKHVVAEARRLRASLAREASETAAFNNRSGAFFHRQAAIQAAIAPIPEGGVRQRSRVREHLYDKWERQVFLPIQTAIEEKIQSRDAEDAASSLPHSNKTNNTNAEVASSNSNHHHHNHRRRASLKDSRQQAFLRECGKKERGLFLETMDAAEYDPRRQREEAAIRYSTNATRNRGGGGARGASSKRDNNINTGTATAVNANGNGIVRRHVSGDGGSERENDVYFSVAAKEAQERQVTRAYLSLALTYQEERAKCRTGVLSATSTTTATTASAPASHGHQHQHQQQYHLFTSQSDGYGSRNGINRATAATAAQERQKPSPCFMRQQQRLPPPPPPPPAAFTAITLNTHEDSSKSGSSGKAVIPPSLRRTHIPYDFTAAAASSSSSHRCDADAYLDSGHGDGGEEEGSGYGLTHPHNSQRQQQQQPRPVMPLLPPLALTAKTTATPTPGSSGIRTKESILACYCPDSVAAAAAAAAAGHAPSHRERTLPISQWDGSRLADSYFARYFEADGDNRTDFCERKQWEGTVMIESQIRLT